MSKLHFFSREHLIFLSVTFKAANQLEIIRSNCHALQRENESGLIVENPCLIEVSAQHRVGVRACRSGRIPPLVQRRIWVCRDLWQCSSLSSRLSPRPTTKVQCLYSSIMCSTK